MQATSRTNDLCDACLMSKHNMVKGMQATSRTLKALSYGQRHASIKSHICMDGCFMVPIFLQWYQNGCL